MEKKDLSFASISELSPFIESQEVKPSELLESCIEQIDAQDSTINAFITTTFDQAREQASILDKEALEGKIRSPLHGIPIAIKDLFDLPPPCSSNFLPVLTLRIVLGITLYSCCPLP